MTAFGFPTITVRRDRLRDKRFTLTELIGRRPCTRDGSNDTGDRPHTRSAFYTVLPIYAVDVLADTRVLRYGRYDLHAIPRIVAIRVAEKIPIYSYIVPS